MIRHYTPALGRLVIRRWFTMFLLIFCITAAYASSRMERDEACVACTDPVWTAAGTYTGGMRVSLNNKIYEARWWTQGENPETRSGEWDVWRYIGPCDGGSTNVNPTVSLTAPANGASFTAPASITLTATASDTDGTVAKVGFYQGGTLLGEDTSAPYSYTWTGVGSGTYSLTARATDNAGGTATTAAVSVTVTGATNASPAATLTAPANGASFTAPASIALTATASDADGTVAKVGFYNGATLLGEDTSAPFSYTWTGVPAGTYSLRAVATDNAGATGTSATASVTVNGNTSGGCNVPSYVNGSSYSTGDEVQYNNKKYKCEVGGWCSLGGAYEPGIGWAWDNAWELLGDCTGGNNGPSVAITAPTAGTNFPIGQSISIAATASDVDGSVTKVEFLVDGAKIGEDTSAPYSISWTATQGFHTLVARATDNSGFTKESAAVSITAGEVNTGGLPTRIMSGYWHTWGGGVPFVKLRDVSPKWDVINISFVEPVTVGSTNGQVKFVLSGATADYTVANFKSDIKLLQSQGKKIVISIGGYEGYFSLTSAAARATFVSNMKSIIDEYGFDGIDIDLEQSSLELETGDADFRNPTSPKVVNMIGAIRDLCNHYGNKFILSFAPEAFYLQLGYQWYAGLHSSVDRRAGVYIPVIHALRDKLTYVQSQLYNQPAIMGLNGTLYSSGNPDYLVSMTDMLLKGFNVGGNPAYFFPPLRPDQVVIAVPSSAGAAGSGQVTNQQLQQAFSYIVKGQSYGGQYTMTSTYPALRGIMAWSINWDVLQNNNSFVNSNRTYLDGLGAPAAAARAAAPVASMQAAATVPAGWGDFQVGLVSDNTNIINVRMKKALQENVKLNYRYAYINNGVDPSSNALSWLFNQWGTDYSRNSQEMGLRPAYVIYMLQEEGGAAALKNNIRNADFMRKYFTSIRTVAEKSNGYKAIFVIEPDTWGYFLQNALEQGTVSDPRQVPATVSNLGAGYEHLNGLPNTLSGVAQGIIRTLRLYAPDSYSGLLMSFWSVNGNGVTGPPVADGAKGMVYWNQGDVTYSAQRNAEFANQLLPATGDRGDFIGVEKNGWSAGNWFVKQNRRDYYWNDEQNAKWVSWSKTLSQGVSLPLLGWQISIGHMGLPNTVNRYEDTFMPYFFTHKQEFFDAGFIGFLAGKGLADCTDFTNLSGNSLEANGNAGDNGWFFEQLKAFDAGRPYLTGVTPASVSITSPAAQSSFTAPASVQIVATAGAGSGGTITKVEFFQGAVKLGEDTSAPYAFSWTNVTAGSYSLTAKVTTSGGTTATSSAVAITVTAPNTNTPPVVSLTAPVGGTAYTAPATVVLQASASDNGAVAKVEFFQGNVKLGEDTSAPYAYTWSNVAAGSYALTAKATDNEGVSTTSAVVSITVANPTGGCTGVPQYVENSGYVAGSQVQQGGSIYQCREWPYSGWCNGAAWAYGPGTGIYWQDAWVLKGACGAQQRVAATDAFATEGAAITLYPNPGESNRVNVVTIDFTHDAGDVAVQVMKADGAQLVDRKYQGVQRSLRVEVPSLPSGLYLIRIGAGAQSGLVRYLVR
jgi:chitinase